MGLGRSLALPVLRTVTIRIERGTREGERLPANRQAGPRETLTSHGSLHIPKDGVSRGRSRSRFIHPGSIRVSSVANHFSGLWRAES